MKKLVLVLLFSFALSIFTGCNENPNTSGVSTPDSSKDTSTASSTTDSNQSGVNVDGSIISFANMKIDNPDLNLTDTQKEVIKYFDDDYLYVFSYENLQKYPKAYRNAQISIRGVVAKVLNATDDEYECLFGFEGSSSEFWEYGGSAEGQGYLIIKGKQPDNARIIADEELSCYGRYIDIQSYEIDGKTLQLPVISVNYTTDWSSYAEGAGIRFDFSSINKFAKAILGNNIKVKEPICDEDFVLDELHHPQYFFYLVTPDNQSNSQFTAFEFSRSFGMIRDVKSTVNEIRYFNISADFQHYIVSVYYKNTKMMYLEYYDRDFKKLWGREFENVDTVPYDYTADNIYLVADNDLYIIDTKTGEDTCDPIMVGQKVKVNVTHDGIILIGQGKKDNVMKTDRQGKIVWKTSVDINITRCGILQIVDENIIMNVQGENAINVLVVDKDGNLILNFNDYEFYY